MFDHRNSARTIFAVFLLLTFLLWISGLTGFQYQSVGKLAFTSGFPGPVESWISRGPLENIVFTQSSITLSREISGYSSVQKLIQLPSHFNNEHIISVTINGIIKSSKIPQHGKKFTSLSNSLDLTNANQAYLTLQMFDEHSEKIRVAHVGRIPNKPTEIHVNRFIKPPENTTDVALGLLLRHSFSQFTITSANVELVKKNKFYIIFSRTLFATILLAALYCIFKLFSSVHPGFLVIGTILFSVLLLLLMIPVKSQLAFINLHLSAIGYAIPTLDIGTKQWLANISHLAIFTIAGCYVYSLAIKISLPMRYCAAFLLLLAVAGEVLQLHFVERSVNFNDLIHNIAGVTLSVLLCRGLHKISSD